MSDSSYKQLERMRRKRPLVVFHGSLDPDVLSGIVDGAEANDWQLLNLRMVHGDVPASISPMGAIMGQLPSERAMCQLRERGCPTVRIGKFTHPQDDSPVILPDWPAYARMAAEHFAQRGFKHLGYVGITPWGDLKILHDTFQASAIEHDCEFHLLQISERSVDQVQRGVTWYENRSEQIADWLKALPKPIGLLGFSDHNAATLAQICTDCHLSIPEEVGLLGIGNDDLTCMSAPVPLSSVDTHAVEHGRRAVRILRRMMAGSTVAPDPVYMPPVGVVTRQSSDVLATGDPDVARAMRYMWDHLDWPLSVEDIARESDVPRRRLERAFRRHLGRGINAELLRRRLERVSEMLLTTDKKIRELAEDVGFQSAEYLHRQFRRTYGMSPTQFRDARGLDATSADSSAPEPSKKSRRPVD